MSPESFLKFSNINFALAILSAVPFSRMVTSSAKEESDSSFLLSNVTFSMLEEWRSFHNRGSRARRNKSPLGESPYATPHNIRKSSVIPLSVSIPACLFLIIVSKIAIIYGLIL